MMNQQHSQSLPENFENLKLKDIDQDDGDDDDESCYDYDYDESEDYELQDRLIRERSKLIVNEFLQQVVENRFFEFSWPPDPDCPAYKYGYINELEKDLLFLDRSETATKFVDQVQRSWGYDIDCVPPGFLGSSLRPIDVQNPGPNLFHHGRMMSAAKLVVDRINTQAAEKMGKTFELVQVNKAVVGSYCLYLLSLTIKEVGAGSEMYVRATVSTPTGHDPELEECKLVSSLST